jgi:hypothetical protein
MEDSTRPPQRAGLPNDKFGGAAHFAKDMVRDSFVEKALRDSPKSEQAFIKSLRVGEQLLNKIWKDFPRAPLDPGTKETKKFRTKISDFFKDTKVRDLATRISQVTAQTHQLRAQTTEVQQH